MRHTHFVHLTHLLVCKLLEYSDRNCINDISEICFSLCPLIELFIGKFFIQADRNNLNSLENLAKIRTKNNFQTCFTSFELQVPWNKERIR